MDIISLFSIFLPIGSSLSIYFVLQACLIVLSWLSCKWRASSIILTQEWVVLIATNCSHCVGLVLIQESKGTISGIIGILSHLDLPNLFIWRMRFQIRLSWYHGHLLLLINSRFIICLIQSPISTFWALYWLLSVLAWLLIIVDKLLASINTWSSDEKSIPLLTTLLLR